MPCHHQHICIAAMQILQQMTAQASANVACCLHTAQSAVPGLHAHKRLQLPMHNRDTVPHLYLHAYMRLQHSSSSAPAAPRLLHSARTPSESASVDVSATPFTAPEPLSTLSPLRACLGHAATPHNAQPIPIPARASPAPPDHECHTKRGACAPVCTLPPHSTSSQQRGCR